jgi:hypothetical protein
MDVRAKYLIIYGAGRAAAWVRAATWAASFLLAVSGLASAQSPVVTGGEVSASSSLHGTVLNQITHEAISRALVYSTGGQFATLTDDRGHFEFQFPPQQPPPVLDETITPEARQRALRHSWARNARPGTVMARKPGFLEIDGNFVSSGPDSSTADIKIYLIPESLIVGQINIPGSEGELRIPVQLYRLQASEGQQRWVQNGTFLCWSDGEFRFAGLRAGTYKLVTEEQLDRDPFTFNPGEQLYGFPPVFYPNANDFATASPIQLGAGATFQANLSVARREYYSVRISVANGPMAMGMQVRVNPAGHPGPGYSLGYNHRDQAIEGMLPSGNYSLETEAFGGEAGSTGVMSFSVRGAAFEGAVLNMVPNASVNITVTEERKNSENGIASPAQQGDGTLVQERSRRSNVQVVLHPIEEFPSRGRGDFRAVSAGDEDTLVIPNVGPGRYRVNVQGNPGYASSVVSGGADLLRGDLVIAQGTSVPSIEVTVRDDGAEVTGTIEQSVITGEEQDQVAGAKPMSFVYFVPVTGSSGQFRESSVGPDNTFMQEQLPPGAYRVLAFHRRQENLAYADVDAMRPYESKGEVIQLSPGQKETLHLKLIPESDSQ